jgi:PAS domain S-box-containing protein
MLDMKTVLLSVVVSNALITVFIAVLWYQKRKRFAGLSFWLIDYVLQMAGFLLLVLRGVAPDVVSIVIGNTMIVAGVAVIYMGLERFVGRPRTQIHNYLIILIFVCLMSYFTFTRPDMDIRTTIIDAAISLLTLQCAWLMLRRVEPSLRPVTRGVGITFSIYSFTALSRIIYLLLKPLPAAGFLFELPTAQVLYILGFQMLNVALTFSLILMVTSRLARDVRTQERRYESLYDSMQEGTALHEIIYDANNKAVDYRILDVNPAYEKILGLNKEQVVGRKALEIYGVDTTPYLDIYAKVAATRQSTSFETYIPSMGKHFSISVFSPEPGRFATIFADITERKTSEQELEKLNGILFERTLELVDSEEKFKGVFQTSRDFTFISTLDGRILDSNESVRDFFGYSSNEIRNMNIRDFYAYPEERDKFKELVSKKGYVENHELKLRKKDGTTINAEITVVTRKDRNGDVVGFQGSVRDITERRMMEQQLQQSEKLSTIGTMISGVAHELNNPLTSIIGNAQLLLRRDIPDEIREKLNTIFRESKRSAGIVNGLLAFAREHKPERKLTDINDVIRESLKLRDYDMKVSNIEVKLSLADDLPETMSDPFQLQQVFINLINNARDALADRQAGALVIRTDRKGDAVLIEFEDNGPGIAGELVNKIFDPFFTTKEVGKGTGLGLSMAYGIMKEHDGSISAESGPGRGAKFVVTLPITKGAEPVIEEIKAGVKTPPGSRAVLVVEDEASLRDLLVDALSEGGFLVEAASTGEEAIQLVERRNFDAVISDIKMPGIGGKELYLYIQKHHPEIAEKIVFITGDVLSRDTQSFLQITNSRFIEKPFSPDALVVLLNDML